jgi:hypothetical protein
MCSAAGRFQARYFSRGFLFSVGTAAQRSIGGQPYGPNHNSGYGFLLHQDNINKSAVSVNNYLPSNSCRCGDMSLRQSTEVGFRNHAPAGSRTDPMIGFGTVRAVVQLIVIWMGFPGPETARKTHQTAGSTATVVAPSNPDLHELWM